MSRPLTLRRERRSQDVSGPPVGSPVTQDDLDTRTEAEKVMDRAREFIAASQRSLQQGTELVRQCREIVRHAKPIEPVETGSPKRPPLRPLVRAPSPKPTKRRARGR